MTVIAVVNETTILTDDEVALAVGALQKQVDDDWYPAWGSVATLIAIPKGQIPPANWVLTVLDDSDQAGALGYHDVTDTGQPLGKTFAKTDIDYGLSWTITASHELLEMLGDPDVNSFTLVQTRAHRGVLYPREVCDAVEDDQFGYEIDGVKVSDFVYPSYFQPGIAPPPYDHRGVLTGPLPTLTKGGYMSMLDLRDPKGWTQVYGEKVPVHRGMLEHRAHHRRQLYMKPHHERRRSTRWAA